MRPLTCMGLMGVLWGCGGEDAERYYDDPCDMDWPSQSLSTLAVEDWPEGLDDAVRLVSDLPGRWQTTSCDGAEVIVKISMPSSEELEVFTGPAPGPQECGCLEDPDYLGDNAYQPVARTPIEWIVDGYDDPGVTTLAVSSDLYLYGSNQPLRGRACTTQPASDEAWETESRILRVDAGRVLSAELYLDDSENQISCRLENWIWLGM